MITLFQKENKNRKSDSKPQNRASTINFRGVFFFTYNIKVYYSSCIFPITYQRDLWTVFCHIKNPSIDSILWTFSLCEENLIYHIELRKKVRNKTISIISISIIP